MTYGDYCAKRDKDTGIALIGIVLIGTAIYLGPALIKEGIGYVKNVFKKPDANINYDDLE